MLLSRTKNTPSLPTIREHIDTRRHWHWISSYWKCLTFSQHLLGTFARHPPVKPTQIVILLCSIHSLWQLTIKRMSIFFLFFFKQKTKCRSKFVSHGNAQCDHPTSAKCHSTEKKSKWLNKWGMSNCTSYWWSILFAHSKHKYSALLSLENCVFRKNSSRLFCLR